MAPPTNSRPTIRTPSALSKRSGRCYGANSPFTDPDHLVSAVRRGLHEIQYRPQLIDGVPTETGLAFTTNRPCQHHTFKVSRYRRSVYEPCLRLARGLWRK